MMCYETYRGFDDKACPDYRHGWCWVGSDGLSGRSCLDQNESSEWEKARAGDDDLWNDVFHDLYFLYDQVSCKNQLMETAVAEP